MSPHVQVWRWHVTMAGSILHRVTGMGLYVGAFLFMGWALSLAGGPDVYAAYAGFFGSILGRIILIALSLCVFYHLANGVRHLTWDAGYGFAPQTASSATWLVIAVAILGAVAFWSVMLMTGAA